MIKLKISSMTCNHCASKIKNALEQINVKHEINLAEKVLSVDVDNMQLIEVIEKLETLGYSAERI